MTRTDMEVEIMTQKLATEATSDWIDDYVFHLTHIVLYPPTIKVDEEDTDDPKNS